MGIHPTWKEESALWAQGYRQVAGVDEAGRGPLAGPVVAAAAILPPDFQAPWLERIRDSKLLTPKARSELAAELHDAVAVGVGHASSREIDRLGLVKATHRAMRRAVSKLHPAPDYLLVDGRERLRGGPPKKAIVDGDALCYCIAAASIVAKVARDRMMEGLDRRYPGYGFARHKGYATRRHMEALARLGPSPVHRRLFAPVRRLLEADHG